VHQVVLSSHVTPADPAMTARLHTWTEHFLGQGADAFTAGRRALGMLYRETLTEAEVLAYVDNFWLLLLAYVSILFLIPFMRRVRRSDAARARTDPHQSSVAAAE
jgi:hypothetical protein